MSDEQSRAEILGARGHGQCLEAIKLTPDPQVRKNRLRGYLAHHEALGINTKATRRAERILKVIETSEQSKKVKSEDKKQREQQRSRKGKRKKGQKK